MSINIENINYSDFKNICRTCMFNCDVKFYLDCVVSSFFHKLTDLHFETDDDLPKQICGKCFGKIKEIHEFMFQCKRTHFALMECLNKYKQVQLKQEEELANDVLENTNITKKCQFEINLEKPVTIEEKYNINVWKMIEINENNEGVNPETIEIKEEIIESIDLPETSYNFKEDEISKSSNNPNIIKSRNEDKLSETSRRKQSGERLFTCEQCTKSFTLKDSLKKHMLTHSGERPFKCDQCSKSFKQLSNMNAHMRTHSGERPYKCRQCAKSFTRKGDLKKHMLTHTGERPFKCDQCSKSFNRLHHVKVHMRTHIRERPFKCNYCYKSFTRSERLELHVPTHTGERPFKCDQCSKSFAHISSMKTHMRIAHQQE